ncbi:MAG: hypothetical protein GWP10_05380, partial [Nitrospiraceae bacterium]|nr:hypothetical protein [Nitrospiraceae bacterium]
MDLKDLMKAFGPIEMLSHKYFRSILKDLETKKKGPFAEKEVLDLASHTSYLDIVRQYRQIIQKIGQLSCQTVRPEDMASQREEAEIYLLFLFHLIEMEGLSAIHEEVLQQISHSLLYLVRTAEPEQLQGVISKGFALLKQEVGPFPRTALRCIETLGLEVLHRDNTQLIGLFLNQVIRFGFQPPGVKGADAEWHILSSPT